VPYLRCVFAGQAQDWMGQHNAVIMTVMCLIIAIKLTGDAIGALA
jgi:hypothetical protein